MKITKRVSVGFSEDDFDILKGLSKQSRETLSGFIRRNVIEHLFNTTRPPNTPANSWVPALNRPPQPPVIKLDLNYVERDKFVADNPTLMVDFSIEMKLKMKERRDKIDSYEENLLKEVEIK